MSYGGEMPAFDRWLDPTEEYLDIYYARGDILFVAAGGNRGDNSTDYPAGYRNVISVAALSPTLEPASFSQYNPDVELIAPGEQVLSTLPSHMGVTEQGALLTTSPVLGAGGASLMLPAPIAINHLKNLTGAQHTMHAR